MGDGLVVGRIAVVGVRVGGGLYRVVETAVTDGLAVLSCGLLWLLCAKGCTGMVVRRPMPSSRPDKGVVGECDMRRDGGQTTRGKERQREKRAGK